MSKKNNPPFNWTSKPDKHYITEHENSFTIATKSGPNRLFTDNKSIPKPGRINSKKK